MFTATKRAGTPATAGDWVASVLLVPNDYAPGENDLFVTVSLGDELSEYNP